MKRLLMISTDRSIFEEGSAVRARQVEYAKKYDQVHIVVFNIADSKLPRDSGLGLRISDNCYVYSTDSKSKLRYPFDAARIGSAIATQSGITEITCQDASLTAMAGVTLKRRCQIPLEIQIHEDIGSPYYGFSLQNKIRRRLAMRYIPQAERIRVVSERIKRFLVEKLKVEASKIEVRPIAVDTEWIKSAPVMPDADLRARYPQFEKIVLMVSRLEREKDIALALRAWQEVIRQMPKAGLLIVGAGSQKEKLVRLAAGQSSGSDKGPSVIFESWADRARLASYYKTADLYLNTSLFEGYGLTFAEAHAAGCPIVSTDVGVAREMGATIAEHRPGAVAQAILAALGRARAA